LSVRKFTVHVRLIVMNTKTNSKVLNKTKEINTALLTETNKMLR